MAGDSRRSTKTTGVRSRTGTAFGVLLLGALAVGNADCSQQRAPLNHVQPYALDKNDFIPVEYQALINGGAPDSLTAEMINREPVFYTQTTMISKPTTTGFTGLTSYSSTDKIRWEVTENSLIGRQAYEFVHGAPGGTNGIGQDLTQASDVVAVFHIESHFDIRYDYNPSTGEQLNVMVENSIDRPWYQRQYMRVDWSTNLIDAYAGVLQYDEWTGQVESEPVPVYINTPNDPNAPVFDYEPVNGQQQLQYFDFVNRAILHPERVSFGPDLPNIPVCILGEGETDCQPAQVDFRMAFRRVDPTRDYEPASLTVPPVSQMTSTPHYLDMERFGFFDTMRIGFDPVTHLTVDLQRMHFASRHNLWMHHHALVYGAATSTGCNVDADCPANPPGSSAPALVCKIGNTAHDASHRGVCAALAINHVAADTGSTCQSDDDCRWGPQPLSHSAVCDMSSHTCGEHYYRCIQDSDCAHVDANSTCDATIAYNRGDNTGLCLMPFLQRQVRPIAYHESPTYPSYMQPVTDTIVTEWNGAFTEAVQAARQHECELNRSIDPSMQVDASNPCRAPEIIGTAPALGADALHVYVGCHATVWGTDQTKPGYHTAAQMAATNAAGWDLPACGPQGTQAHLGDLRYNMIGAITDQDQQGYWGLANIASDPETGEMVAGRGAVWQTITDAYAFYLVELIKILNGDAAAADVADGQYLVDAMNQLGGGAQFGAAAQAGASAGLRNSAPSDRMLNEPFRHPGAAARLNAATASSLSRQVLPGAGWFNPHSNNLRTNDVNNPGALTQVVRRLYNARTLGDNSDQGSARRASLAGTDIESQLMNQQQASLAPTATVDTTGTLPATLAAASPFRGQSPAVLRAIDSIRTQRAGWECDFEADFTDEILLGLARRLSSGTAILHTNPMDAPVAFGQDWNFKNSDGSLNYTLMTTYAAQFIHHGVLAHELGHSLGQRHNFTASADAINYNDQYWRVRGQGHHLGLAPRYAYLADPMDGNYYSDAEISGQVDEWSYSSVMDYKGLNEDAHGIGRYDRAFIRNGYVGMVEAFKTVADQTRALTYAWNVQGYGLSTPLDFTGPQVRGMHYTQIPAIFGTQSDGTPNIGDANRYNVFIRETTSTPVAGLGPPIFTNTTADGHLLVPYRYDDDLRAGLVWQDQRYDSGADAFESLHYVAERYIDYYFANSYARYRSGFSTGAYVDRQRGRYLEQMRQCAQLNAFDLINYQDFLLGQPGWTAFVNDPNQPGGGGYVNQAAESEIADAFVGMVAMNEMGVHTAQTLPDSTTVYAPNLATNAGINIPVNQGRLFESNWRTDVGYWWYEQLNSAGAYYDKTLALDALTDPELLLLQRDTPVDIRLFQLSFYTMYPDQILRLFGGVLSEDYQDYGPIIETNGTNNIERPHLASINLPPGTGANQNGRLIDRSHVPLDPQDHFTTQIWAAVMSIAQFPATYDQRYMDYARLWIDGSVESVTVTNPDVNTVSFTDPWTHETFRALHFGANTGEPGASVGASAFVHPATGAVANEAGVAARMILHMQDMEALRQHALATSNSAQANTIQTAEQAYEDLLHVMRRMTQIFGSGHIVLP